MRKMSSVTCTGFSIQHVLKVFFFFKAKCKMHVDPSFVLHYKVINIYFVVFVCYERRMIYMLHFTPWQELFPYSSYPSLDQTHKKE
jgi:hypothetical protein